MVFPPMIGVSSKPYVQSSLLTIVRRLILSRLGLGLRRQKRMKVLHGWRHVKNRSGPLQHVPLIFKPFRLINRSNSISNLPALKQNYSPKRRKWLSIFNQSLEKLTWIWRRKKTTSWKKFIMIIYECKLWTIHFLSFPYIPMLNTFLFNEPIGKYFTLFSLFLSLCLSSDWRLGVNYGQPLTREYHQLRHAIRMNVSIEYQFCWSLKNGYFESDRF